MKSLPEVLVVSANRYASAYDCAVTAGPTVDFARYCVDDELARGGALYDLSGIVVHTGSWVANAPLCHDGGSGHYISYVRDVRDAACPWYVCNDASSRS